MYPLPCRLRWRECLVITTMGFVVVALCGCDTTPPGAVTNLLATAGDAEVVLTWTNPGDSDLAGVLLIRKTGAAPASKTDGTAVYSGLDGAYTDATVVNGTEYFYAAYAYDKAGNYGAGVQANATPTSAEAQENILGDLVRLRQTIVEDLDDVLTEEQEDALSGLLEEAEALYRGGDPCGASEVLLGKFLQEVQEARTGEAIGTAEDLYNQGRMLRYEILGSVLVKSTCPGAERLGLPAEARISEETTRNLAALGVFGEPMVQTIVLDDATKAGGKQVFTQVHIPGADGVAGGAGLPGVPIFRRLIAAPRGSQVQVGLTKAEPAVAEEIFLNLYPCQEQPVDAVPDPSIFENRPFARNLDIYASDAPFPPNPVTLIPMGNARDLQYYLVEIATGQYYPRSNRLVLFEDMDLDVQFTGGSGAFLTEGMLNPFESSSPLYTQAVLNKNILENFVEGRIRPYIFGEELLILTHPDFNDAAITLRNWKRDKGIWANVYQCGTGSGISGRITSAEIDAFIQDHYDTVFVRPSYILFLGDAEFIPPGDNDISGIGTDWPYTILGTVGVDTIPDFAIGRIPVDTLDQANTVVNKIIAYENSPPVEAAFYSHAALASQFQCCRPGASYGTDDRTFVEVSEFARNVLTSAGKTVDRLYMETGTSTPTRYYSGTLLPTAIGASSGFAWNADEADITNAWNEGRFLVMHRDHGWQEGWSHPEYELPAIDDLTNGAQQPVVFSVNCASGFWDNETADPSVAAYYGVNAAGEYFCEKLLRKANGGAIAILGDTRNSPSWENSVLTQGFYDAIWPSAISTFGPATAQRRLGDVLNHGKLYLMSMVGSTVMGDVIDNSDSIEELYLWHCIGDPTLEIWTGNPNIYVLPQLIRFRYLGLLEPVKAAYASGINIEYEKEGAIITVYEGLIRSKEFAPIGRGVVKNGAAFIDFLNDVSTEAPLTFIASAENAKSRLLNAQKMN